MKLYARREKEKPPPKNRILDSAIYLKLRPAHTVSFKLKWTLNFQVKSALKNAVAVRPELAKET